MRRFDQYCSNLRVLETAPSKDYSDPYIVSGLKDRFVLQFELSWKVLKEALVLKGVIESSLSSPRSVLKHAVMNFLDLDEELWLEMLDKRNLSPHMYDEELVNALVPFVIRRCIPEFQKLERLVREELSAQ